MVCIVGKVGLGRCSIDRGEGDQKSTLVCGWLDLFLDPGQGSQHWSLLLEQNPKAAIANTVSKLSFIEGHDVYVCKVRYLRVCL